MKVGEPISLLAADGWFQVRVNGSHRQFHHRHKPGTVTSLLQELQALEVELHHPGVRCNRERLARLLHPEFEEVGRSGRSYDRETIVNFLLAQKSHPAVTSEAFSVSELGPGVALLTYRSAQLGPDKNLVNHTLRSSVWLETSAGWQLRYHQGTAAAETW